MKNNIDETDYINKFLKDDWGYGDPEARLNDDRKITILLAKQQNKIQEHQIKAQKQLNWLTFMLVIVGIINILVLFKN